MIKNQTKNVKEKLLLIKVKKKLYKSSITVFENYLRMSRAI